MTAILAQWKLWLIGGLLVLVGFQQLHIARQDTKYAELVATTADNARKAEELRVQESEAARIEEARRYAEKDANVKRAQEQAAVDRESAARAERSAVGLRQQVARLTGAIRQATGDPVAPGGSPAANTSGDLLERLFGGMGDVAAELGAHADRSRTAGLACERAYEALTQKITPTGVN